MMPVTSVPQLSPRDMSALNHLKHHHLSLIEIKITDYSPTVGKRLEGISFPENTRSVCVIRNHRPITELEALFLEEMDLVYLLTDNESIVRDIFTLLK